MHLAENNFSGGLYELKKQLETGNHKLCCNIMEMLFCMKSLKGFVMSKLIMKLFIHTNFNQCFLKTLLNLIMILYDVIIFKIFWGRSE